MDQTTANDEQRTARAFVGFFNSMFANDQSLAGADGYAVNLPRQYQTIGPNGLVGVEGTSLSNGQKSVSVTASPLVLIALAAAAFYFLKK